MKKLFLGPKRPQSIHHEPAHQPELIALGGEQGGISTQHSPSLRAQDALQILDIAIDGFEIRILAGAEQGLDEPVRVLELAVEPAGPGLADELRSLAQKVEPRAVAHLHRAIAPGGRGDAAEDEFRIEAVAALLQVAAVGHLRDQIRGAEEVSALSIAAVRELDLAELDLVAGEMNDARRT